MMAAPWQASPGGHGIVKLPKLLPHGVLLASLAEVPLALETPELVPLSLGAPVVGGPPEDVPLTTPGPTKVLPETAPLASPALLPVPMLPLAEPMVTPALLLPLTVPRLV
jgi:hypothetical protein